MRVVRRRAMQARSRSGGGLAGAGSLAGAEEGGRRRSCGERGDIARRRSSACCFTKMRWPSTCTKAAMTSCSQALFEVEELQDDFAAALAGSAHLPHALAYRPPRLERSIGRIAPHRPPCPALGQRRGDGVIGPSSDAHSREIRPRWNFWSLGPFVVIRRGHRRCEHFGKLA
jgi:hypothetical protein